MDPSAAPWRVLESSVVPVVDDGAARDATTPPARAFIVSPVTAAAVIGATVLAVAAFLLASASASGGSVAVEGGGVLTPIGRDPGSAAPGGVVPGGNGSTSANADAGAIVVEIVGAVRRPGVFHLPPGSRVGDLVAAAGGYGPRLDAERASRDLNLAARLADGDRVSVPSRDEAASSTSGMDGTNGGAGPVGGSTAAAAPVDLNRATQAELEALPGIGPVTATKIIASREERAFTAVDDLRTRKLIGAKTFDQLKDLVTVH